MDPIAQTANIKAISEALEIARQNDLPDEVVYILVESLNKTVADLANWLNTNVLNG